MANQEISLAPIKHTYGVPAVVRRSSNAGEDAGKNRARLLTDVTSGRRLSKLKAVNEQLSEIVRRPAVTNTRPGQSVSGYVAIQKKRDKKLAQTTHLANVANGARHANGSIPQASPRGVGVGTTARKNSLDMTPQRHERKRDPMIYPNIENIVVLRKFPEIQESLVRRGVQEPNAYTVDQLSQAKMPDFLRDTEDRVVEDILGYACKDVKQIIYEKQRKMLYAEQAKQKGGAGGGLANNNKPVLAPPGRISFAL